MPLNLSMSESDEKRWKEECEAILRSCRIVQTEMKIEIERERSKVTEAMATARAERLEKSKKEYEIKQLQIHQQTLEWTIEDFKEELKEKHVEFDQLHREYLALSSNYDVLSSKYDVMDTKLQLAYLSHDRVKSKVEELDYLNKELELKLMAAKLSGFGETSEQSGKLMTLFKLKLEQLETTRSEDREISAMELAKEKKRVEELTTLLTRWERRTETHRKNNIKLTAQVADLESQLKKCGPSPVTVSTKKRTVLYPLPLKGDEVTSPASTMTTALISSSSKHKDVHQGININSRTRSSRSAMEVIKISVAQEDMKQNCAEKVKDHLHFDELSEVAKKKRRKIMPST